VYYIYIDESGDRGMKPSSSEYFVVSALVVRDLVELRGELARIRAEMGRPPGSPLHFRKMAHMSKLKVTREIGSSPHVAAVASVIMCKRHIKDESKAGGAAFISIPDPMYLFALRMVWERLSWYVRDNGAGSSKVIFSQVKHFQIEKVNEYRARLENIKTKIHWPSFAGHEFQMRGMEEVELLQLADSCASGIASAIEPTRHGDIEDHYLRNISPKLYRRTRSDCPLTTYGLRVFPPALGELGGHLHHLNNY
jgi:hypothetical protein